MSASPSPAAETHQSGFTQVPNAILKANHLSLGARMLYGILLSYCYKKDYCYPSYETLMRDLGCHSQALRSYIVELLKDGLIRVIRPGQGRTNIYIIAQRSDIDTPDASHQPAEEAENSSSVNITEPALRKPQTEEYEVKEYRYSSNTRKTETSGHDYVNSHSSANQPQDRTQTPHQPRVEQYRTESRTPARTIENIEPLKTITPAREIRHDLSEDITRGVLLEYMSDFATEFNDQAPLQSSITRAYHLYQQSGLTMDAFTTYLYTARAVTKERTASIRKYTERGVKTKMAYFFAILEDKLGLREKPLPHVSQSP